MIGSVIVNGRVDVDRDGNVDADADDVGRLGRIPVFEGGLDFDKNGVIDSNDDGEVFNVVVDAEGNRVVVAYRVIDGYIDVDGDEDVNMDLDDAVVIGVAPGVWVAGSVVANEDDLGDGFHPQMALRIEAIVQIVGHDANRPTAGGCGGGCWHRPRFVNGQQE